MTTTYGGRPTFEIGRVIERTFGVIGHNAVPFLAMAAVFAGLPQLVVAASRYMLIGGDTAAGFSATATMIGLVGGFFTMAGGVIMQGGVMQGTIADLNGEKVSLSAMFETGFRHLLPLIGVAIVYGLAVFVSLFFLIIPGLIVAVVFSVAAPSVVVERTGVFGAFSRSRELTRNHRWMIFFLLLIYWVLFFVINMVLLALIGVAASSGGGGLATAQLIFTPIASTIQGLLTAAGLAAIYYELRSIKEGIAPESLLNVFD